MIKQRTTLFFAMKARTIVTALASLAIVATVNAQNGPFNWAGTQVARFAQGTEHVYISIDTPRALQINCVRVDSKGPGIAFRTTPRAKLWKVNIEETWRQTTRNYLVESRRQGENMVVAINADAFSPWPAPYDIPTATNIQGLAIADGTLVSPPKGTPSLLIRKDGTLDMIITDESTDITGVELAVSGFGFCLQNAEPIATDDINHPRTGFGLSEDRRFLYLMTIDGRRHASIGCAIKEVGEWLKYFGAHTGINMDGGGSTTLVRWNAESESAELLNHPVGDGQRWHEKPLEDEQQNYRPAERANGNNFGVVISK